MSATISASKLRRRALEVKMKELKIQIIDARNMNLICHFQTFVNERLHDLQSNPDISDIRIAGAHPDYVVISFYINCHPEELSSEDDYKPP